MKHFVYIIFSASTNKYYIGSTSDIKNRLLKHNQGGNVSTKNGKPWQLKYSATFEKKEKALIREKEIKNEKSKKYIEWLISSAE